VTACTASTYPVQVCLHTRLLPETFHRAVQLTDTFSHTSVVVRGDYQLVGTCALWIAAKVDERYVPSVSMRIVRMHTKWYTVAFARRFDGRRVRAQGHEINGATYARLSRF
jgi:hypothetical protein